MKIAQSIVGEVDPPPGVIKYDGGALSGLPLFFNNIINFVIVIAGIYALVNIILAGYLFMSAADDPKKMAAATSKIWQSLIGLAIAAGSFTLASIFGKLIFNDYSALLQFQVFGPGP